MKQQPIPDAALDDEHAIELMRVWIAKKGMHTSLNIGLYQGKENLTEEKAWGMILADAARHVANALNEGYGTHREDALLAIRRALDEELDKATTAAEGRFTQRH